MESAVELSKSTSGFFTRVKGTAKSVANYVENKWDDSSTITKACVIGAPVAVLAPLAIIPALGAVGFTSAGVAAGSIAASLQTATTASGSVFALCQSAGAVGAVATTTSVGVRLGAGATASGVTVAVFRKQNRRRISEKGTQTTGDNKEIIKDSSNVDVERTDGVAEVPPFENSSNDKATQT